MLCVLRDDAGEFCRDRRSEKQLQQHYRMGHPMTRSFIVVQRNAKPLAVQAAISLALIGGKPRGKDLKPSRMCLSLSTASLPINCCFCNLGETFESLAGDCTAESARILLGWLPGPWEVQNIVAAKGTEVPRVWLHHARRSCKTTSAAPVSP